MMQLLSPQEAEKLLAQYFSKAVPFSFGVMSNGKPAFKLKNPADLIVNRDGSVTWTASEVGIGLHSFIELTTGEETQKTVYIPLCLVNARTREFLQLLVATTIDPADGRYNSKEGEFYVLKPDCSDGADIHIKLENLATQRTMMYIMPSDFALKFKTEYCPFCRKLGEVE